MMARLLRRWADPALRRENDRLQRLLHLLADREQRSRDEALRCERELHALRNINAALMADRARRSSESREAHA